MSVHIRVKLTAAERHFRHACQQVTIISRHMEEATIRFHAADKAGDKNFRYHIRLRLSILDGVRNMYYEYAAKKATEIVELQQRVLDVIGQRDVTLEEGESELSSDDMYGSSEASHIGSNSDCSFEICN
ncbi:hypothetical protein DPMN_182196 [Dreissena polymorpha]|uniref:Uncharacterized protein n=1 Tax=Dreissena polymorpha TaxID=45954 RepID=A0A9D4DF56_DREPO|nr:hypothetical protein DPMN_182196 [Dreissena polymorpha]